MLETINSTKTIGVLSDAVWTAVAGIGGIDRWLPLIESCRAEGRGEGALRFLRIASGGEVEDRVDEIDHQPRRFRYTRRARPFPSKTMLEQSKSAPRRRIDPKSHGPSISTSRRKRRTRWSPFFRAPCRT
ncbi:SRPBCC family protein [Methylocella tundrae]|uniref:Uncharacterized protein n=1 Tax=Methylocella tundrae TaxID=227605 RepID=A0A4U8YYX5_METTU|nr:protein of unknown function [Methylocella tundrae]